MSFRRSRSRLSLKPLLLAPALALAASPAMTATQWGSYQWASAPSDLEIDFSPDTSSDPGGVWASYVNGAAADWGTYFAAGFIQNNVDNRKCPPQLGHVQVCNKKYGYNGWLGVAQIWTSGGFIIQGAVKLNDSYFASASYNTPGWRSLVSCQEVGHTLGLSHDDEDFNDTNYGTCMDYTSDPEGDGGYLAYPHYPGQVPTPTFDNHTPNSNDYALLDCMYAVAGSSCGHNADFLNGTPPAPSGKPGKGGRQKLGGGPTDFGIREFGQAQPPAFTSADAGNSPAEWGKAVAFTADGRGRVFEREIAPGRKIVTEVFWAPR